MPESDPAGPQRDVVAAVLGVAPGAVEGLTVRQVLRRASGRELTTWTCTVGGKQAEVVTVVGDGGPRRGLHVAQLPDGRPVAAFRPVDDPRLPGLAVAMEPARLAALLGSGVGSVRRRRYRPLGRAVVEASTSAGPVWVKVLRPDRVAEVAALHEAVAAVAPGPPVLARDDERGLLVLGHLAGTPLRTLVRRAPHELPDARAVVELSQALAAVPVTRPSPRTAPLVAVPRHVARLRAILPDAAEQLADVAGRIEAAAGGGDAGPTVTIHGDLHSAQVLAADGRLTGVLDLDDVGGGTQADDLGRFLGHLDCTVAGVAPSPAQAWAAQLDRLVRTQVPASVLAPRVAAVVLGLATGPHRVHRPGWQERSLERVRLAGTWLDVARW